MDSEPSGVEEDSLGIWSSASVPCGAIPIHFAATAGPVAQRGDAQMEVRSPAHRLGQLRLGRGESVSFFRRRPVVRIALKKTKKSKVWLNQRRGLDVRVADKFGLVWGLVTEVEQETANIAVFRRLELPSTGVDRPDIMSRYVAGQGGSRQATEIG